jgi:sulfur carrier protein ThiS
VSLVKLVLRNKEYEVKPGMTLLSALQKINVLPESVIATREGEMILDDEILQDGDVIKLIAVISGGSQSRTQRLQTLVIGATSGDVEFFEGIYYEM